MDDRLIGRVDAAAGDLPHEGPAVGGAPLDEEEAVGRVEDAGAREEAVDRLGERASQGRDGAEVVAEGGRDGEGSRWALFLGHGQAVMIANDSRRMLVQK